MQQILVSRALGLAGALMQRNLIRTLVVYAVYALVALVVLFMFVRNYSNPMLPDHPHHHAGKFPGPHKSGLNAKAQATFPAMLDGTADRPYVNRALIGFLVRSSRPLLSESAVSKLTQHPRYQLALKEIGLDWAPEHTRDYLIGCAWLYLFLLGFVAAMRALMVTLYDTPRYVADLLGLATLLILPPFFELYGSYVYDFPSLCLYTLGLVFLARGQHVAFLIVFAVGLFSKETTVLLTFVFCMYHAFSRKLSWRQYLSLALIQCALFVAVKLCLGYWYGDNAGGTVEFHLFRNISKLPRWSFGTLAAAGLVIGLVVWQWKEKPLFLRAGMIILVPLIGLTFLFGYFDEMRDYYEAMPLVMLLMLHSLARIFAVPLEVRI